MITFIIGNGFDLNLGMKTRYIDVYDSYIKSPSKSKVIENFKAKIDENYENWSDFEMGMAEFAHEFATEDEFVACVRDFKQHMVECLRRQQNIFLDKVNKNNNVSIIAKEILRTTQGFYTGSTPNVTNTINKVISSTAIDVKFITFNYTTVLDTIVDRARTYYHSGVVTWEKPIHIHGTLDNDVVLGVDDITQMNHNFTSGKKLQRAFVKPYFNQNFDDERVRMATTAIFESNVICTFGWSFGKTDATWVKLLKEWLISDEKHHLIVFKFGEYDYPSCNSDERMDKEDEMEDDMTEQLNSSETEIAGIYDRIHMPIGYKIFNFEINDSKKVEEKVLITV